MDDTTDWPSHLDAGLLTHIRRRAARLHRDGAVPGMDRGDLEQELLLDLWRRRHRHDPARSPFGAFARMLTAHRAASLAEPTARRAAERDAVSLDAPPRGGNGDGTLADLITGDASPFAREEEVVLGIDVRRFVAGLTPAMQRCCVGLAHGSAAAAAAAAGLHRSSAHETLRRVRRRAAASGLGDHLGLPPDEPGLAAVPVGTSRTDGDGGRTARRGSPTGPEPACGAVGHVTTEPRALEVAAPGTPLGEDRRGGSVPGVGHRGLRGGESARCRFRRDGAVAASMSDPLLNPQFRRRWKDPDEPRSAANTKSGRAATPVDTIEDIGSELRAEWRHGRFPREGGER